MLYIMRPDGERSYCYKIKTGGSFGEMEGACTLTVNCMLSSWSFVSSV